MLGQVALRVEVDEQHAEAQPGEVLVLQQGGLLVLPEQCREGLGDAYPVQLVRVLGERLAHPGRDRRLADTPLLVAHNAPLHDYRALDLGSRVLLQPHLHGLGEALDQGHTSCGAVGTEVLPLISGKPGRERLRASRLDTGEVRAEPAPGIDARLDRVLDVDAVLRCANSQVTLHRSGELGDDLLASVAVGGRCHERYLTNAQDRW